MWSLFKNIGNRRRSIRYADAIVETRSYEYACFKFWSSNWYQTNSTWYCGIGPSTNNLITKCRRGVRWIEQNQWRRTQTKEKKDKRKRKTTIKEEDKIKERFKNGLDVPTWSSWWKVSIIFAKFTCKLIWPWPRWNRYDVWRSITLKKEKARYTQTKTSRGKKEGRKPKNLKKSKNWKIKKEKSWDKEKSRKRQWDWRHQRR